MLESSLQWSGVDWNMQDEDGHRDPWNVAEGYIIWTKTIGGIWFMDFTQEAVKRPRAMGDRAFDSFPQGQSLTFSGTVRGTDMTHLREGQLAMYEGWFAGLQEDRLEWTWAGQSPMFLNARLGQRPDMVEEVRNDRAERTFTFVLRCDDPTVYINGGENDGDPALSWQTVTW